MSTPPNRAEGGEGSDLPALFVFMAKQAAACGPSMNDYQAEDDHRTLTRAAEVRSDPKRMAGVKKHHAKQTKALGMVGRSLGRKR